MDERKRPLVLVVDDVPENIHTLADILRDDYAIQAATSGDKALETAAKTRPDLILLDVMMPGVDGYEICRLLKQDKKLRGIPVIFVTSLNNPDDEAKGFAAGGVDYIVKPVSPPIVRARVATHLTLKDTETRLRETLHKTLAGAVSLLTDVLTLSNPVAYSRAARLKRYVKLMAPYLDQPGFWQFELAALFSQVGSLSLPPGILEKIHAGHYVSETDKALFDLHPQAGSELVGRIPHLENVAAIIARQELDAAVRPVDPGDRETVALGTRILRTVLAYDRHISMGLPRETALGLLKADKDVQNREVVEALEKGLEADVLIMKPHEMFAYLLNPGYVLQKDVFSTAGELLLVAGTELSTPMIQALQRFASHHHLVEPMVVLAPD
jgi:putative two-component system response regulator